MRSAFTPDDALQVLGPADGTWWIAGGWALDLHLQRTTRDHEDLDIAVSREQLDAIRARLDGWELWPGLGEGQLLDRPLGEDEPSLTGVLWCRPSPEEPWAFELLVSDIDANGWRFKRDPSIALPAGEFGRVSATGIPFLRPEIVLLHKANRMAPCDQEDFGAVVPFLDHRSRSWLSTALARVHPDHPWHAEVPT